VLVDVRESDEHSPGLVEHLARLFDVDLLNRGARFIEDIL
jgi:hypothetical protein